MSEEIKDWLESQHPWLQDAAYRILTSGNLSSRDISELVDLIKGHANIADPTRAFPGIGRVTNGPSRLHLISIGPIEGIDALNPRKPLDFGSGNLTVVYGSNGAGKSGYTRIITKACGKPHGIELKTNVHAEAPQKRQCTFTYRTDGIEKQVEWPANSAPIAEFECVDVFDTANGRIYLENETELSYAPSELALFTDLVGACKKVEAVLSEEQKGLKSRLPKIPPQYLATEPGKFYDALVHDSDATALSILLDWSAEDEAALTGLKQRLDIADPGAAAKKRRSVKEQIDLIRSELADALKTVNPEAVASIRTMLAEARSKRESAKKGADALGTTAMLEGIDDQTWRSLWKAAREYSMIGAYPASPFPHTEQGARCVLCHQELDAESRQRLQDFESFVQGKLESEATAAESALAERLNGLPNAPAEAAFRTAAQAAELPERIASEIASVWKMIEGLVSLIRSTKIPDACPEPNPAITQLLSALSDLSEFTERQALQLDADAKDFDRASAKVHQLELEARKWISQQKLAVLVEMKRLEDIEQYEQWKRLTGTTGISRKAGALSEVLITEAYIDRFNGELRSLGATRIQVELVKTRTAHGKSKHSIRLKNLVATGTKPSEVLSEGESRIVALAAFLADVTGRPASSPFIFDDPISSLDQGFEERTIDRLIGLSETRQVLVFTHRLSFLGIMNDRAGERLHNIHIRREPWGTGEPGEIPIFAKKPDKALNSLKGERVARARKILDEAGQDAYYPLAKAICSDFRILNERIVETVFLADVVQRHRRAVNTKNKVHDLAKISQADCDLIDEMMTKYSCFEHSQSDENPIEIPGPDELESDIDRMIAWHEEFKARKTS